MSKIDYRPEVRIAILNGDGTIDTTGQGQFEYYEELPQVGDVIVEPSMLDGSPVAVVVVGRQFIRPAGEDPRWWVIVRPAEAGHWQEVCKLDDETNQAFAEMRAELYRGRTASLLTRKRRRG